MNKYNNDTGRGKPYANRCSIRLKGYNYSQAGLYFITICCQDKICRFGHIENGEMILNQYGTIAFNEWEKLSERFHNFELDVFQIMPNHMHGIIALSNVRATLAVAQNHYNISAGASPAPTVFDVVGAYKSLVANGCLKIYISNWAGASPAPTFGKLWQRNYYEHIIRNDQSYHTISNYILMLRTVSVDFPKTGFLLSAKGCFHQTGSITA